MAAMESCENYLLPTGAAQPVFHYEDVSVELEVKLTATVMGLFTTDDGTVEPLLRASSHPPTEFLQWLDQNPIFAASPMMSVPFDPLSFEVKFALLRMALVGSDFWKSRKIPGLRMKDKVELNFISQQKFLGQDYSKGRHLIDISKAVGDGTVEMADVKDENDLTKVELHLRLAEPAGEASNDAVMFTQGRGIIKGGQHVHIPAKLPIARLRANPNYEPQRLVDFCRRANLLAEMISIFEGVSIMDRGEQFSPIAWRDFVILESNFSYIAQGDADRLTADPKMAWVGIRSSATYTNKGLWGLEYRSISALTKKKIARRVLNRLQDGMVKGDLGIDLKDFISWSAQNPGVRASNLWYSKVEFPEKRFDRRHAEALPKKLTRELLQDLYYEHREVRMLFHDWHQDTVFIGRPVQAGVIEQAQDRALEELSQGIGLGRVMRTFLRESGIWKATLASFQLEDLDS